MESAEIIVGEQRLPARAGNAIANETQALELTEQTDQMLNRSGLIEHYKKEKGEKGQTWVDNLEELVSAAREFEYDGETAEVMDMLTAFLAHAALEAGEGQGDPWEDCVQMMTLHSAKGLEFPLVFLCGMEEGLFPHKMSMEESSRLAEERRLYYVGITRARQLLYITHAEVRRLHGQELFSLPSRFVSEIPDELIHTVRPKASIKHSTGSSFDDDFEYNQEAADGFYVGQRVFHQKFGEGVLLSHEGRGSSARVQVNFDDAGSKWLVIDYANLSPC